MTKSIDIFPFNFTLIMQDGNITEEQKKKYGFEHARNLEIFKKGNSVCSFDENDDRNRIFLCVNPNTIEKFSIHSVGIQIVGNVISSKRFNLAEGFSIFANVCGMVIGKIEDFVESCKSK